jgi:hypothetical protein
VHASRKRTIGCLAIAVLLAGTAQAQRRPTRSTASSALDPVRIGPHFGYSFDASALILGVQATLPVTSRVEIYPSWEYYFVDPGTLWAINADVKFRPPTRLGALYVGGGIDYLHASATGSGSGDVNLDVIGGWEFRRRRYAPYAEGRLILGNGSAFQVAAGFNFKLH